MKIPKKEMLNKEPLNKKHDYQIIKSLEERPRDILFTEENHDNSQIQEMIGGGEFMEDELENEMMIGGGEFMENEDKENEMMIGGGEFMENELKIKKMK